MHPAETVPPETRTRPTPLLLRNDTMLGVCAGLGEEFGFNPTWLRVLIASLFLVSFKLAIGIYLALGVALVLGRLLFPPPPISIARPASWPQPREANDSEPRRKRSPPELVPALRASYNLRDCCYMEVAISRKRTVSRRFAAPHSF